MKTPWHLDDYQEAIEALIADMVEEHGEEVVSDDIVEGVINDTLPEIVSNLYAELAKRSASMLRQRRKRRRGFVKRNVRRWRGGFDLLERLIEISQETGQAVNSAHRPLAVEENDALFEAIISNHARAIQVSREILSLMIAGFPDGALGRWRTLHEIAVVSMFLSQSGRDTAELYILHDRVSSCQRARNYMNYHERANLGPIEPEIVRRLEAEHDGIIAIHGEGMKSGYGWAGKILGKERPTFADLENATRLDHWRPRYKWATTNTHGAYRTLNNSLGASESDKPVLLVGESNSGMTDPGHMTAISLNLATWPVIALNPNLDRLVMAKVMHRLSDEIGETFLHLDRASWQRELERRAQKSWFNHLFRS